MARALSNPPNPWETTHVEWLGEPPAARLEVYEEDARSVVTRNESPDIPFRFSVNPYRGCQHACSYCYARPGHQHLSFGAGSDFEKKIVVKVNAPEVLRRELRRPSLRGQALAFSGVTDCYQPLEACYRVTRRCLEACLEAGNPVSVVTKGSLVRRDADLLERLARGPGAQVMVSIPFADPAIGRLVEPGATTPDDRFETLRLLSERGIETGVAIAPLIPGLNEPDVPRILERARQSGARSAFLILLRLPAEVLSVFRERIEEAFPDRAARILAGLREMRGGRLQDSRYGSRMHGTGARWEAVTRLFELTCARLGLSSGGAGRAFSPPPPAASRQGELFPGEGT